jgi:hypothetical protein
MTTTIEPDRSGVVTADEAKTETAEALYRAIRGELEKLAEYPAADLNFRIDLITKLASAYAIVAQAETLNDDEEEWLGEDGNE